MVNTGGPSEVDAALDHAIALQGALLLTPLWNQTYPYVGFQLTELQRVQLLEKSGTTGGDGDALLVDIYANAFTDLAGNGLETVYSLVVEEERDTIAPTITFASIHFGTGILSLNVSELVRMDHSPLRYDLTRFIFANTSADLMQCLNQSTVLLNTTCAGLVTTDTDTTTVLNTTGVLLTPPVQPTTRYSNQVHLQLGERARVNLLQSSATQGGDGKRSARTVPQSVFNNFKNLIICPLFLVLVCSIIAHHHYATTS